LFFFCWCCCLFISFDLCLWVLFYKLFLSLFLSLSFSYSIFFSFSMKIFIMMIKGEEWKKKSIHQILLFISIEILIKEKHYKWEGAFFYYWLKSISWLFKDRNTFERRERKKKSFPIFILINVSSCTYLFIFSRLNTYFFHWSIQSATELIE
jgi:hypothetical protein